MLISLHKNGTTTPATRLALQQATGTDRELAQQYGIGIGTVRKWRSTSTVHDASHTRPTACKLRSMQGSKSWLFICAASCGYLWMTCWRWCERSLSRP